MKEFIPIKPLSTAVLFLVFNRLDTTKQVFAQIKKAKPPRIYIASDGAREAKTGEEVIVEEVRDYVIQNLDWECEVKTLLRDENLGCKVAVSSAIDWFFEHEDMGIILEDDVVPTQSFFWFCERMLQEYRNDSRVMMISGTNYMLDIRDQIKKDYFFSRHFTIWGWATWKRAWKLYDVKIPTWRTEIQPANINFISNEAYITKHFENTFDLIHQNKMNTWDIQWVYTCLFNYGLCLTPSINMISNVGVNGTHTTGNVTDSHYLKTYNFESIDRIKLNSIVYPEQFYDEGLHIEKTLPAYRKDFFMRLLKTLRIYEITRSTYRFFK
ncbi:MAG: nucleotide-diphospho-sugar transferase [Sulfurimonas sp.]|nr:nucleotide-diphospho-sugar transferase [Sulfurimonas sp.]MBU3939048.1 nucleotide-diphospho-sugar transferase [bacterium]MBU4024288.1 nucleotide-diphospho-sugar transferase [bacterium]MBU4059659.1 nucleotide-diphospho-sugar transferase [bacterium]